MNGYVIGESAPQTPGNPSYDPNQPGVCQGDKSLFTSTYFARYRASARHSQDVTDATSHIGFRTVVNNTSSKG
jgi:formylglycine-generating enzyme required for sulfatase activity